jgi:hypothetical protein
MQLLRSKFARRQTILVNSPWLRFAPKTDEKTKYWLKKGYMLEEKCNETIDVQRDR